MNDKDRALMERDEASSEYMERVYSLDHLNSKKPFLFYLDGLEIFNAGPETEFAREALAKLKDQK